MFNNVKYKSNKIDTDIILRSFDINATKVGYSIEEDKCYWTSDFEDFLKTGELKLFDSVKAVARFLNTSQQNVTTLKTCKGYKIEVNHYA
jgi:hypothetical protein